MITCSLKSTTTFDLGRMANSNNGYDKNLPHPMTSEIIFVSKDGSSSKALVGQIATLVAIANEFPNIGAAIDHMFKGIPQEEISKICGKF